MTAALPYPDARRGDAVDDHHGTKVADPYRWLEDTDDAETRTWIAAQNAITEAWLAEVSERNEIRRRLSDLMDHPRAGAPWQRGGRCPPRRHGRYPDPATTRVRRRRAAGSRPARSAGRLA